jgi:hypothetical protein
MLASTRLLWGAGPLHVSHPTVTPGSRLCHTLWLSLRVWQRATGRWQRGADDRSHPSKINAQGQIVGAYSENSNTPALDLPHGFLLDNSVFTTIEASDATAPSTIVSDINDHGQLVGAYDLIIHGYLRDEHGEFTLIDVPEVVTETASFGINTHGQIVGFYLGINEGQ